MLKKIFCSFICMMSLLMLGTVAFAQVRPSTFTVTPYLGGYLFDNAQKLRNAPVAGISLGYNFTKYFGVEASGEYIATKYDPHVSHSRSTDVGNYRLDGILNLLPDSRLVPFVFAGVGGQSIDYPRNVPNRDVFAVDYGAGLRFFFTYWLALRADVRQTYIFDDSRKDFAFTAGATFYFGGPKPASASRYEPVAEPTPSPAPMTQAKVEEKVVIMASEPKVEEKVAAVVSKVEEKVIIFALDDVHFDFDQSALTQEAQTILKRDIQRLKENPNVKVRVAGYTSASGTAAYDQKLSERRANAVRDYLIAEGGIAADRLTTIGYGKTHPAVHEAAPKELYSAAAKANMRVLFEIIVQ